LRNVLGIGAPVGHLDEGIFLAELVGDRPQRLVHDHGGVEDNLAFLARAFDQLLLAIRPAIVEDVDRCLRGGRAGTKPDRKSHKHRDMADLVAHASPPFVSISASAMRTP
jgi:hypothetical protein